MHFEKAPENLPEQPKELYEKLAEAGFRRISAEEVPEPIMQGFENYSRRFMLRKDFAPGNFEFFFRYDCTNGDIVYGAEQLKTYDNGETERLTYHFEVRDNEEIGHGELRFSLNSTNPNYLQKPFVGFSATENPFRGEGLGKRRLELMNAYCLARYDEPLSSSTQMSHDKAHQPNAPWSKLVAEGSAERYDEGNHIRYRFKPALTAPDNPSD